MEGILMAEFIFYNHLGAHLAYRGPLTMAKISFCWIFSLLALISTKINEHCFGVENLGKSMAHDCNLYRNRQVSIKLEVLFCVVRGEKTDCV